MRTKRTFTIVTVLVALAALSLLGAIREPRRVQAQDQAPPQPERISFGMVGITQGQTIRLSVANTIPPPTDGFPPGPSRVVLTFLDAEGRHFRHRDGSVVRRALQLQPGRATFLDLNADDLQIPPFMSRIQLRAVVTATSPPFPESEVTPEERDPIVSSVEVFNNSNGRTVLFIGNPGVIRGFNPQPDPPLGQ